MNYYPIMISGLSAWIGGWMVIDGLHVILTGKYIGPPEPGPWSYLVRYIGLDPMSLGIPFVALGIAWLLCALLFPIMPDQIARWTLLAAICTLWYLPIGTVLSVLVILFLYLR